MTDLPPPPEAPLPPPPDAPPPPPAEPGESKFGRWKNKAVDLGKKANEARLERAARHTDLDAQAGGPIAEFTQSRISNTISPERILLFEDRVEHVAKEMTSSSTTTISFDQPIQVRVDTGLRHGTLVVEAVGSSITLEKMPKEDAEVAKNQILAASNRWRTLMRTTTTVNVPAAAPPPPAGDSSGDLTGKLAELASLHQAGALTDAEFAAAKARLLS